MFLCLCKGITEAEIQELGHRGILGAAQLIEILELDDELCCGRCALEIHEFQEVAQAAWAPPPTVWVLSPSVAHSA